MFCSHCGVRAGGNFCHSCGAMLSSSPRRLAEDKHAGAPALADDWADEVDYRALLAHPEVRARIAAAGSRYRAGISGEDVLALFDALVSTGVSLEKLGRALAPIYDKFGIRTGKTTQASFDLPPGRVLTAVLCSLAAHGIAVRDVQQDSDGCILCGTVPSSVWSFAGELVVAVHRREGQTTIEAGVKIPGQLYDWGKSQRLLKCLLQETSAFAA